MKYTLIALLVVFTSLSTLAQKHSVFADVGWNPGFSVTYNYKPIKRLGVGIGVQGYKFTPTLLNPDRFTPAVFADIRLNIRPEKNNQFFSFLDLGINFYKQDSSYSNNKNIVYDAPRNNGFYSGVGFGYLRRITKRGGGPYASLKLISNWSMTKGYNFSTQQEIKLLNMDGALVFSLGFKF